jgi:hypothetical protein
MLTLLLLPTLLHRQSWMFLFSQQPTRRSQKGKEHMKQHGKPSVAIVSKSTSLNNYGTSTSLSSSSTTTPLLLGGAEVPPSALLLLRFVTAEPKENSRILVLMSFTENDPTLLNSAGAREAPKLLAHENNLPPPIILQSRGILEQKNATPPEGSVRRRVEEIETSWGANHKQPPSMYTSVATSLEVWVIQEPNSYAYPTIYSIKLHMYYLVILSLGYLYLICLPSRR